MKRSGAIALLLLVGVVLVLGGGCGEGRGARDDGERARERESEIGTETGRASETESGKKTIHLTDVTGDSGIEMIVRSGATPSTEILEVDGCGLALLDIENDGDLDLFVANGATLDDTENGPGCRLFRNDGGLRFNDVTEQAGIDLTRWAMGVTAGDSDGDGFDDLYVCCFGANVLLRNTGTGRFEDVTARAGVGDDRWGTSCGFGDVDGDGDLDLYVVNYIVFDPSSPPPRARYKGMAVMNGPHGLPAQHDVLYENLGDGTFRDVTETAGCLPARPAFGLNVAVLDFDLDHRQDILVANDSMPNFLFHNLGEGRFEEMGMATGVSANMDGSPQATMGITIADLNGNGFPDLFTTNFSSDTNTVHLNLDGSFFDDRTLQFGLALHSRPYLGWACGFVDLDHDGDEDLLVFNGHVYPQATVETMDSDYEQPPLLYEREGKRFTQLAPESAGAWLGAVHRDRAAVFGDLDGDGDVDVVVSELNGPVRILRNDAADERADWILVELCDAGPRSGNRRGLGSRVVLTADGVNQTRWIYGGGSFQSSSAHAAHFGVPAGADRLDLLVVWPDGTEQRLEGVEPGRVVLVERETPATAASGHLLERIAVVGASASFGFNAQVTPAGLNPLAPEVSFGAVIDAAIEAPHAPVEVFASAFFFQDPMGYATGFLAEAIATDPTLVVGLDFLFWFGYGAMDAKGGTILDERDRLELLDAGLGLLETLECPVVVGDFPDMSAAVGGMIHESQMPEPETLDALNERLRAWAAPRENVLVVPLAESTRLIQANEAFTIGQSTWPAGSVRRLIQWDRLHPTAEGLVAMGEVVWTGLIEQGWCGPGDLTRGSDTILERLRAGIVSAREQQQAGTGEHAR